MKFDKYNFLFVVLLIFHTSTLVYMANDFSIAYKEIVIFQNKIGINGFLTHIFGNKFCSSTIAIKLPFIILYSFSTVIFYLLTEDYFKYQKDRLLAVAIFMILPGINSAALLVNESIVVIFFTLLYLLLYKKTGKENYFLLVLYLFIDNSFAILYLALFFSSLQKKNDLLLFSTLILFGLSMNLYGFEIVGKPKNYFIDTFGIYASIFSPFLFVYFFYAIYRFGIKYKKDMFWYLSSTALVLSFVLSLRQKIDIEDFAPFVVVAIPVMVKMIIHSIRVRLREHQRNYLILGCFLLFSLALNFGVFVFNKVLYIVLDNPRKHFAYDYHIAKELAEELKNKGITQLVVSDHMLQERLHFYGISNNGKYSLLPIDLKEEKYDIEISYFGKIIAKYRLRRSYMLQN